MEPNSSDDQLLIVVHRCADRCARHGWYFPNKNFTHLTQIDIVLDEYATSDEKPGIKRKIQGVVIHPEFDEETLKNDLAVVTLRSPISLTSGRVTPIWPKLQNAQKNCNRIYDNTEPFF